MEIPDIVISESPSIENEKVGGSPRASLQKRHSLDFANLNGTDSISDFNKKRRSHGSFSNEARNLKKRASHMIIEVPVAGLKKIRNTDSVNSLSRETQHFVGITTMHGPLRIYRGKGYITLFWGAIMFGSSLLLMWQIVALFMMYTGQPIVSEVNFLISTEGVDFPMVTVCNFNPIRRSYIKSLNASGEFSEILLDYLIQSKYEVHALFAGGNETMLNEGDIQLQKYILNHPGFSTDVFFRDGGFDCDDMVKICSFAGVEFDCCDNTNTIFTDLGKCFLMNTTALPDASMRRQTAAGVNSGLQIVLDAHLEEQFDGTGGEPEPFFTNALENGFRYYVHEKETIPHVVSEGISVSPGARVYSALTASSYQLLDRKHWGNCTQEWPKGYKTSLKYSSANCASICKAKFFEEKCGCSPFVYNVDNARKTCDPYHTYTCIKNYASAERGGRMTVKLPLCSECEMECESWGYAAYNSYGQGLSNGAVKWIQSKNSSWSAPHIRTNFVALNVFFRDMAYTQYNQRTGISFTEILSDIGGNMGMFLGMSLMTFVEVIIYLTKVTWIALSRKRREYMFNKKKQEEEKEKELTETISKLRTMQDSESDDSDAGKLRRLQRRLEKNFKRAKPMRMNRIAPVAPMFAIPEKKEETKRKESRKQSRKESRKESRKDSRREEIDDHEQRSADRELQRKRFMDNFYSSALYGDGRAADEEESELPNQGSVLELKIDIDQFESQLAASQEDGELFNVLPTEYEYVNRENRARSIEDNKRTRTPSFFLELPSCDEE